MKSTNHLHEKPVLILGGTGKTGRRIVSRLRDKGIAVRIGSRTAQPAFDWEDSSTWKESLQGINSVYVTYQPDLAIPGAADTIAAFAELAVKNGVQHLVLLSGRGEEGALLAEKAIQEAGTNWTIVRASWFCQNFSEGLLLESVLDGNVVFPAGNCLEPFIDVEDIADVVTVSLTEPEHKEKLYEVTGPELLTFADAVRKISDATGQEIRYTDVSGEEYARLLGKAGMPMEIAEMLASLFTTVLDGRNSHVADGIQKALGRRPRSFDEYARTTAASGIWQFARAARC